MDRRGVKFMKVFVVTLDWGCEDNKGHDIFIYKEHSDAYDKFKELILDEREPSNSWVGNVEFDFRKYFRFCERQIVLLNDLVHYYRH